jgi:multicomponent Na+:H+ antiporter subunit D
VNSALVPLPIVIPLFVAAITIIFGQSRAVQRVLALGALTASAAVSIALLVQADEHDVVKMDAGGWAAPLGITYVVDRLSAIMLVTSSLMLLIVMIYAIGQHGVEQRHVGFHPVYLVLAAGVSASFITGDMFNLFVAFEMMLAASYVRIRYTAG